MAQTARRDGLTVYKSICGRAARMLEFLRRYRARTFFRQFRCFILETGGAPQRLPGSKARICPPFRGIDKPSWTCPSVSTRIIKSKSRAASKKQQSFSTISTFIAPSTFRISPKSFHWPLFWLTSAMLGSTTQTEQSSCSGTGMVFSASCMVRRSIRASLATSWRFPAG